MILFESVDNLRFNTESNLSSFLMILTQILTYLYTLYAYLNTDSFSENPFTKNTDNTENDIKINKLPFQLGRSRF